VGETVRVGRRSRVGAVWGDSVRLGERCEASEVYARTVELDDGCHVGKVQYIDRIATGSQVTVITPPERVASLPPPPI
jgi:hypothetical protein